MTLTAAARLDRARNTPPALAAQLELAADPDSDVVAALASGAGLGVRTVEVLANDPWQMVRRLLALNSTKNVTTAVLCKLAKDDAEVARVIAAHRDYLAPTVVDELCRKRQPQSVAFALAGRNDMNARMLRGMLGRRDALLDVRLFERISEADHHRIVQFQRTAMTVMAGAASDAVVRTKSERWLRLNAPRTAQLQPGRLAGT